MYGFGHAFIYLWFIYGSYEYQYTALKYRSSNEMETVWMEAVVASFKESILYWLLSRGTEENK
jgi:hypothetical protein